MAASAVLTDDSVQPATVKDIFFASVESKISIISVVRQNCPGCIYNCPSQRDHDLCLSVPLDEILNLYLPEIIENVPRRRVMDEFISKIDEKNIDLKLVMDFFRDFDPFTHLNHDTSWQNEFRNILLSHRNGGEKFSDVICNWLYD